MTSPVETPGIVGTSPGRRPAVGEYPDGAYPPDAYPVNHDGGMGAHPAGGAQDSSSRSLGELISEITTDLSTLMRQEVALAKAEATQSAKRAGKVAGMFGGAGFAGYFVLLFLSVALWWSIGDGMGHGWSALIVAVLWAIVAAILVLRGRKEFADIRGLGRTSETLGKIPNAVKGNEEENT